jgi:hypothetical protein
MRLNLWIGMLFIFAGCNLASLPDETLFTPNINPTEPTLQPTPLTSITATYPWMDARTLVEGVCFEAALAAAGQVFVLRDAAGLAAFYDGVDNSQLCRRPVRRASFDFSGGAVLVGVWSAGSGCTAQHSVLGVLQDAAAVNIRLRFETAGTCGYELLRPFWVALPGAGAATVDLVIE